MAQSVFPADSAGIPSGNTANRPASPVIGDTYYDGTVGFLLIWQGTQWIPCSAPAGQPTLTVTDAGSGMAYGTVKASVAFTEDATGGRALGFTATQSSQSATATSSPILVTITGNPGSYSFGGTAYNAFGTSPAAVSVSQNLTSVPQAPTIGTATGQNSQISLTFTAGATGGSAITNYQWSTDGTTYTALSPADTTSPVIIPGLTNGTSYTVSLKAVNANGVSTASGASNSATPTDAFDVEYLVVAGGGGGNCNPSNNAAGGGGAGGYRTNIGSPTLTNDGTYDIVVGGGGAGSTTGASLAGKGSNSRYSTIYSTGGGGGAYEGLTGGAGGSGGGSANAAGGSGNQGGYSPVEGFGAGTSSNDGGNGGGGAGGASPNATTFGLNGAGGIGSNSVSAWATITSSGDSGYFAGGGGGGSYGVVSNNTGTGGAGGGGDGKSRAGAGEAGTANTGGGGGAQGGQGGPGTGGNGGSGIVILKYPSSKTATFSGGLTQTTYTSGSDKYSKITSGTGTVTFS
jgi:hypothetical protein